VCGFIQKNFAISEDIIAIPIIIVCPQSDCMIDTFIYLIRFHTDNSEKYLYFRKKSIFIRTRYRQNQHLWCQNGNTMSPGNHGVFQLLNEVAFHEMKGWHSVFPRQCE